MRILKSIFINAIIVTSFTPITYANQSFVCSAGERGVCLSTGDRVCAPINKCVPRDSVIFNRSQCNNEGFTCRSNLSELEKKHGDLENQFTNLSEQKEEISEKHDGLNAKFKSLSEDNEKLRLDHEQTEIALKTLDAENNELQSEYQTLTKSHEALEADNKVLNEKLAALQAELSQAKQQIQDKNNKIADNKKQIESLNSKHKKLSIDYKTSLDHKKKMIVCIVDAETELNARYCIEPYLK